MLDKQELKIAEATFPLDMDTIVIAELMVVGKIPKKIIPSIMDSSLKNAPNTTVRPQKTNGAMIKLAL